MVKLWCFDGGMWCFRWWFFWVAENATFLDFFLGLDGLGFGATPRGGEFAQAGYGGRDDFEGFVYFFLSGQAGEGEANAGSGAGGCEAHGGEDVGGFGCAGLTGGASAYRDAFEVEGDD